MIEPTQQAWKEYASRLRSHYVSRAASYPVRLHTMTESEYKQSVQRWIDHAYLDEPMYPGQEYANNH